MKHNKGFTLIELMVVIAIIGVLAALAGPSFRTQIQKSHVASQVREFSAILQESRSKAVTLRRNFPFTLNSGVAGGAQNITDAGASWSPNSDRVQVTNGANAIEFNLMGALTTPNEECYLFTHVNNNGITQAVRVGRNGAVTAIRTEATC